MNIIMARYKLNMSKANAICESAISRYNIENFETICNATQGYFTEADDSVNAEKHKKLMDSIKEFFDKIVAAVKKAIQDVRAKFRQAIMEHNVNKHLKELAKMYAKDVAPTGKNGKVKIFDFYKYYNVYKKYLLTLNKEISYLAFKKYSSIEEVDSEVERALARTEKLRKDCGIDNMEAFYISTDFFDAIGKEEEYIKQLEEAAKEIEKLAELEFQNMMNDMTSQADDINDAMNSMASGEPMDEEDAKKASENIKIKNRIMNAIKTSANSISSKIMQVLNTLTRKVMENFSHISHAAKTPETAENA